MIFEMQVFFFDKYGDDEDALVIVEAKSSTEFKYYYPGGLPLNLGVIANNQVKEEVLNRFKEIEPKEPNKKDLYFSIFDQLATLNRPI